MYTAIGYAAQTPTSPLAPMTFERRSPRPDDVAIDILYCGVCHSDIHQARNEWGIAVYPLMPGHEIIGRVTAVGDKVTAHKVGDLVGVGCMVDSCRHCEACAKDLEQYCLEGPTMTYATPDRVDGSNTMGGYSSSIVVSEHFVVRIPAGMDLPSAAPILCAGITTYSPLKHHGVGPGHKIGILGMGGLGHMAIKLAKALGAEVTLFTRSQAKADEARRQGADHVIVSTDAEQMRAAAGRFDFLLDTIPVQRPQPVPGNPEIRWRAHPGRPDRANRPGGSCGQSGDEAPGAGGVVDRWYCRDTGSAGFLRRARDSL